MNARHKLLSPILIASLCLAANVAEAKNNKQADPAYDTSVPIPTLSNISYGTHERQVLDFWKAPSASADKPAPLVFYIHGGSWLTGSKEIIKGCVDVNALLKAGISVVAINYRYVSQAEAAGIVPPVKAPLEDAARALQFVRSKAKEWHIDKSRIGAAGASAGGCSSLWLAYHDDMADPDSDDPVARESTRLFCAGVRVPQSTLDPQQMKDWLKTITYGGHAFGVKNHEFLSARERLLPWIQEYSPYAHVSADDPPVSLYYNKYLEKDLNAHSPQFGFHLQKRCEELGLFCEKMFLMHFPHNHRSSFFTSFRLNNWKVVYHYHPEMPTKPRYELFDLGKDPFEQDDRSTKNPQRLSQMVSAMALQLEKEGALFPETKTGEAMKPIVPKE